MYFCNECEGCRRIINVVCSTTSCPAKCQVVTQIIKTISVGYLIDAKQENVNYLFNAEVDQCIKAMIKVLLCKAARDIPSKPHNFEVESVRRLGSARPHSIEDKNTNNIIRDYLVVSRSRSQDVKIHTYI